MENMTKIKKDKKKAFKYGNIILCLFFYFMRFWELEMFNGPMTSQWLFKLEKIHIELVIVRLEELLFGVTSRIFKI